MSVVVQHPVAMLSARLPVVIDDHFGGISELSFVR